MHRCRAKEEEEEGVGGGGGLEGGWGGLNLAGG